MKALGELSLWTPSLRFLSRCDPGVLSGTWGALGLCLGPTVPLGAWPRGLRFPACPAADRRDLCTAIFTSQHDPGGHPGIVLV